MSSLSSDCGLTLSPQTQPWEELWLQALHRITWSKLPSVMISMVRNWLQTVLTEQPKYPVVVCMFSFIHPERNHHRLKEIHDTSELCEDGLQTVGLKFVV